MSRPKILHNQAPYLALNYCTSPPSPISRPKKLHIITKPLISPPHITEPFYLAPHHYQGPYLAPWHCHNNDTVCQPRPVMSGDGGLQKEDEYFSARRRSCSMATLRTSASSCRPWRHCSSDTRHIEAAVTQINLISNWWIKHMHLNYNYSKCTE